MAQIPWFSWKGVRNDENGVVLRAYPEITIPPERVNEVTIPGRSGSLAIPEDHDTPVRDAYNITLDCYIRPGYDRRHIAEWLTGAGELILGDDPDMIISARVLDAFSFSAIRAGRGFDNMSLVLRCQPYKTPRIRHSVTLTARSAAGQHPGTQLMNPGSAAAYPIVTIPADPSRPMLNSLSVAFGTSDGDNDNGELLFGQVGSAGLRYDMMTGVLTNAAGRMVADSSVTEVPGGTSGAAMPFIAPGHSWVTARFVDIDSGTPEATWINHLQLYDSSMYNAGRADGAVRQVQNYAVTGGWFATREDRYCYFVHSTTMPGYLYQSVHPSQLGGLEFGSGLDDPLTTQITTPCVSTIRYTNPLRWAKRSENPLKWLHIDYAANTSDPAVYGSDCDALLMIAIASDTPVANIDAAGNVTNGAVTMIDTVNLGRDHNVIRSGHVVVDISGMADITAAHRLYIMGTGAQMLGNGVYYQRRSVNITLKSVYLSNSQAAITPDGTPPDSGGECTVIIDPEWRYL